MLTYTNGLQKHNKAHSNVITMDAKNCTGNLFITKNIKPYYSRKE